MAIFPLDQACVSDPFNFPQQDLLRYAHLVGAAVDRIGRSGQLILGDRELLPSHTAYATAAAVLRLEARPVFVDLEPGRSVLSAAHLDQRLSSAESASGQGPFRAAIAVHLYGEACDLDALLEVCDRHRIALIEDCAQACGTLYRQRAVGTWGHFAAFSFYPTKNLAAFGDGGALVVNRPEAIEPARRSRFYGWDDQRQAVQFGVNSRLDELQAWVLLGKLADLAEQIAQRRQVAAWYGELLAQLPLTLPGDGADWQHSYHLHVVRLDPADRERLLVDGKRRGLPLALHYALGCHQHPYVVERFGPQPALPETERRLAEILTLPLHPYLERSSVESVALPLRELLSDAAPAPCSAPLPPRRPHEARPFAGDPPLPQPQQCGRTGQPPGGAAGRRRLGGDLR